MTAKPWVRYVRGEHRQPHREQLGFLCCASSSTSAGLKGLVRYVVSGTVCRSYNSGVGRSMVELSRLLKARNCACPVPSAKTLLIAGVRTLLCAKCLDTVIDHVHLWSSLGPHTMTLHDGGTNTITLSFATGTLMRYDATFGKWIDTKSSCTPVGEYSLLLSPCLRLIPFHAYISPTRAGLTNTYMCQAISLPSNRYHPGIRLVPLYCSKPIVISDAVTYTNMKDLDTIPGLDVFAIFMNMELTYEDGMVMSRTGARRFHYKAEVSVSLNPRSQEIPTVGTTVEPYEKHWWQNHFKGVVQSRRSGYEGNVIIVLACDCYPVNGDKFTTLHGQKGVVTVLEDHEMPVVANRRAELVIGTSSIIKRETTSQLLEGACGMYAMEHMDRGRSHRVKDVLTAFAADYRISRHVEDSILQYYEGEVAIGNVQPQRVVKRVRQEGVTIASVSVNYGVIRLMQSCFLASIKMSCTTTTSSISNLEPSYRASEGGSKSLGEMECMQLQATGMVHVLSEFEDRSDMCVVMVCRACGLVSIVCTCSDTSRGQLGYNRTRMPYSTLRFMVASKVVDSKVHFW
jgi:hypothetical protein